MNALEYRAKTARENTAVMEYMTLLHMHIDFYMRMYIVGKSKKGRIFEEDDRTLFGQVINECSQLNFDENILKDIKVFNNTRNNLIHKYLLGAIREDEISAQIDFYYGFGGIVRDYIIREIGKKIFDPKEFPNDIDSLVYQLNKKYIL